MKVLLTGAAGFIGSVLAERLVAEGHEVHGLDDLSTGSLTALAGARRGKGFSFARFDVTDPLLVDVVQHVRPEVVCHLAAAAHADPVTAARVAAVGTVRVLEAARVGGVRKVVVAGDAAVYGRPVAVPVTERAGLAPRTPQAAAAAAAEGFVAAYGRSGGPDWTLLVLGAVYGRGDVRGPVARLLAGEAPAYDGVDLVHVDDVAEAFVLALGERASRRRLNVGSGVVTPVPELRRQLGVPGPAGAEPGYALEVGGIRRALGWQPFTPLVDGLRGLPSSRGAG